jgi:CheY-like chemotaxis protein
MKPGTAKPKPKQVLVVDDNEIILKSISLKLKHAGFHPFTAVDAPEALAVAGREKLDLILLDISFPPDIYGMAWDGFRILESLHQLESARAIPVIIISSSRDERDRKRAEQYGISAFFHKPIDHADLIKVVRSMLDPVAAA